MSIYQKMILGNKATTSLKPSIKFFGLIVGFMLLQDSIAVYCQEISFKRISVENGLSSNLVHTATLDQNGIMWIGTESGLDSYNGRTVIHWDFPEKVELSIKDIYCDRNNELWLLDGFGKLWKLDKERRFKQVLLKDGGSTGRIRFLLPVSNDSVFCWIAGDIYHLSKSEASLQKIGSLPDSVTKLSFHVESRMANDRYAMTTSNRIVVLNPAACKVEKVFRLNKPLSAQLLKDGNLLATTENNRELFKLDWKSGRIIKNYGEQEDQYGRQITGYFRQSCMLPDGRVAITSGYDGLVIFDDTKQSIKNYRHDPLNERTVSGNNAFRIFSDSTGNVFVTTRTSGVNYFNINQTEAKYLRVISDSRTGNLYDGNIQSLAEDASGDIWASGQGGLFKYNSAARKFTAFDYGSINGEVLKGKEEVRSVFVDRKNRLWVGLNRYGVVVLDEQAKPIRFFSTEHNVDQRLSENFTLQISAAKNGNILVSTMKGLDIIDLNTLKVIPKSSFPELGILSNRSCYAFGFTTSDSIWIGVSNGVFLYDAGAANLKFYGKEQGLSGQYITSILPDGKGNVFFAGKNGVEILQSNGEVRFYDSRNNLPYNSVARLLPGDNHSVWVANDYALVLMDAEKGVLRVADGRNGIPATGFRVGSGIKASNGLLYLGTNLGFVQVDPEKIFESNPLPTLLISSLQTADSIYHLTSNRELKIPYRSNSFGIAIDAIALFNSAAVPVEYMLEGYDKSWKKTEAREPVQYQNLPVGNYSFKVRFAQTDLVAIAPVNTLTIDILPPWWRSWWFIAIVVFFLSALISWIGSILLEKRKEKQEALEIEKVVYQFANSMHEKHTVVEIVGNLTRNSIAQLGFEDCVVYLLNENTQMLEQVSAWGDKSINGNGVLNPITISPGNGIVGSVVQSSIAEIVPDTSKDPRYIADDKVRFSEISVPIFADDKVIGVIDSEHSQKNFFTKKHLSLLTTLASILGSRITSIMAEEKKRMAEMALIANERKTAEIEMQALRAQMNPHFMFNSLNSINNFILKNDADNASAYLTRFSRLMRMILDNSRQDWITLENETKALRLYVDMESIRFDHAFDFELTVQEGLDLDFIMVPPLVIQPYVENAIWHGLLHLNAPGGLLMVSIGTTNDYLSVVIEDNGVGRKEAARLKSKLGEKKKSHGLQITSERIRIVNEVYGVNASVQIDDVLRTNGDIAGTRVTLTMKLKQHLLYPVE